MSNGVSFIFIRAAYGTGVDTRFVANWAGARSAGLLRGAYLFYRPTDDGTPEQQAEAFVAALGGDLGELPLVVDVENERGVSLPPPAALAAGARACLSRVQLLSGRRPIVYTNKLWQDHVGSPSWSHDYDLWLAAWPKVWTPDLRPSLPNGWSDWRFWQYSGDGNGLGPQYGVESGAIDLDAFNGDEAALRAYAVQGPIVVIHERAMWVIADPWLNLRSEPRVGDDTLLGQLPFGTQLTAIGASTTDVQGNVWQNVRTADGGIGWVCAFLANLGETYLSDVAPALVKAVEAGARTRRKARKIVLVVTKSGAALRSKPRTGGEVARLKLREEVVLTDLSDTAVQIGARGAWIAVADAKGQGACFGGQRKAAGQEEAQEVIRGAMLAPSRQNPHSTTTHSPHPSTGSPQNATNAALSTCSSTSVSRSAAAKRVQADADLTDASRRARVCVEHRAEFLRVARGLDP